MRRLSAALLVLLQSTPAHAQFGGVLAPPANILQDSAYITQNDLTRAEMLRQQRLDDIRGSPQQGRPSGASPKTLAAPLRSTAVAPGGATGVEAKIAAHYPDRARPEAARVFRELLSKYPTLMKQLGVPPNDLSSSVAAFLAGSYMAYRDVDFPDEHFKPLANQMRQIIGSNAEFAKASAAEKQEMHDQMAILGTFMATTQMALKEKPNPQIAANLKQAAKGYLEQFLKTDAERVQITAQGLVLR